MVPGQYDSTRGFRGNCCVLIFRLRDHVVYKWELIHCVEACDSIDDAVSFNEKLAIE